MLGPRQQHLEAGLRDHLRQRAAPRRPGCPAPDDGTAYPPRCDLSGLPTGARIVDDVPDGTIAIRPNCGRPWVNAGTFRTALYGWAMSATDDLLALPVCPPGTVGERLLPGVRTFAQTWRPRALRRGRSVGVRLGEADPPPGAGAGWMVEHRTGNTHLPQFLLDLFTTVRDTYGIAPPDLRYRMRDLNAHDGGWTDADPRRTGMLPGRAYADSDARQDPRICRWSRQSDGAPARGVVAR